MPGGDTRAEPAGTRPGAKADSAVGTRPESLPGTHSGTLFVVVGPSGAGKDTLLDGARRRLDAHGYVFPARHITRPASAGGESHVEVSEADFRQREAAGGYALSWRAHGLGYGIPVGILRDLLFGRHVVVNVSRGVLAQARAQFPSLTVICITAGADVLRQRLLQRGRESTDDVEARVRRAIAVRVAGGNVVEIRNDGPVATGIARLVSVLSVRR